MKPQPSSKPRTRLACRLVYLFLFLFSAASTISADTIFSDNFSGGWPGAWSIGHDGGTGGDSWAWPNGYAQEYADIFGQAYVYPDDLHVYMERRGVSLNGYGSATLDFDYIVDTEANFDFFTVNIRDTFGNWHELFRASGRAAPLTFTQKTLDLSAFAEQTGLYIQFRFDSDGSVSGFNGVYLDNVVLSATPATGDLSARLFQLDGATPAPVFSDSPRFILYLSPSQSLPPIQGSNPGVFQSLNPGRYLVEGWHKQTFFGYEFWNSDYFTVVGGATAYAPLTRKYPYGATVRFFNNATGHEFLPGDTVPYGTTARADVTLANAVPQSVYLALQCKVRLLLDRSQRTSPPWDYDSLYSSNAAVAGSGGTTTFSFLLTPITGTYFRAIEVLTEVNPGSGLYARTDSWDWGQAFIQDAPPPPTITLASPNGGEAWAVASTHKIVATANGNITGYELDISTDGGTSWTFITGLSTVTTSLSVNYPWTVNVSPSTTCKVRVVVLYGGGSVSAVSAGSFSILAPPSPPSSPTPADAAVLASQPMKFDWSASASSTSYDVFLQVSGGSWAKIGSDLPASECLLNESYFGTSFSWYVIAKNAATVTQGPIWTFTVSRAPTVTLTSPDGGEAWAVGSTHNIVAAANGNVTGYELDISTDGGTSWTFITGLSTVTTSLSVNYPWTVNVGPSTTCKARVVVLYSSGSVSAVSAGSFKTLGPPHAHISLDDSTPSPGKAVHFTSGGSDSDGFQYAWVTSDNQHASSANPTFAFTSAGQATITLRVSNGSATVEDSIQVSVQNHTVGTGGGGSSGNTHPVIGADPVNLASGNYAYTHADIRLPGIGMPLEFRRYYNSKFSDQSGQPLGFGWTFSPSISVSGNPNGAVVTYGDGHAETYTLSGTDYVGDAGVFDKLSKSVDGAWSLVTKVQTVYSFDLTGRIVSATDRNGNVIGFTYDPTTGLIASLTNSAGRIVTFGAHWQYPNLIGSLHDAAGRQILFDYDSNRNLVTVTNAMHGITRFAYNDRHQMTNAWNPRGYLIIHNDYDPDSNAVIHQFDAHTNHTYFAFDFLKHETVQINALGKPSTYRFDENLLLTNVIDEAGHQEFFGYDTGHNTTLILDKNGHATQYAYDERGNVTNKLDALNHTISIEYDERNNPTRRVDGLTNETIFGYNFHGNLTSTTNALGFVASAQYDAFGEPIVLSDPNGHSTTNFFDPQGNLIATVDALGFTNSFVYDVVGRRVMKIDPNGHTNQFGYDNNDNVIFKVDGLGNTNQFCYDGNDNRNATVDARTPPATNTVFFDLKDRVSGTQDALGRITTNYFDALDRKVASLDARNSLTQYGYDDVGNLVALTNALNQVTRFGYDLVGNQTTVTNAAGHVTTRVFDELNRVVYLIDALQHTNAAGFDALGRVTTTTNANGQVTQFMYDSLGRLTNVIDAATNSVFFEYDRAGNRIQTTDPKGNVSTNVFNELSRAIEQWDPMGHVTRLEYDGVGNTTAKTTPNGAVINYSFDADNRLTNVVFPTGPPINFSYDQVGNRTNMVDGLGTTSWRFDLLNRLTSVTDPYNKTVRNDFDENGNRITLTYPDGNVVHYYFDALNRVTSLSNWLGGVLTYGYDLAGNLIGATNANNTTTSYAYDDANRLVALTNALRDNSVISQYAVSLDGVGNPRQISQEEPLAPIILNQTNSYAYDADNRLMTLDGQSVAHDADGNLTVWGTNTFGFDYLDRLTNTVSGGMTGTSAYDGLGNRLSYATGGNERHFVLDRLSSLTQVLAETDTNGNVLSDYVYGLGLVERISADSSVHEYHFDPRGNTIALSDGAGTVTDRYAYRAFGELANSNGFTSNLFHVLGRYGIIDDGNGLMYVRARHYSPELGRFITRDSFSGNDDNGQSLNRYVYALNNPLRLLDLTGFSATECNLWQFSGMSQRIVIVPEQAEVLAPVTANSTAPVSHEHGNLLNGAILTVGIVAIVAEEVLSEGAATPLVPEEVALLEGAGEATEVAADSELSGTSLARQLGQQGEQAAKIVKNTERIPSFTGSANYRIPDVLNRANGVIGEVKNVGSLSYTSQLQDFAAYANENGLQFELTVRPSTQLSGPLQNAIQDGSIILKLLPK